MRAFGIPRAFWIARFARAFCIARFVRAFGLPRAFWNARFARAFGIPRSARAFWNARFASAFGIPLPARAFYTLMSFRRHAQNSKIERIIAREGKFCIGSSSIHNYT